MKNEFREYALKHAGISSLKLHRFESITNEYITPNIIEERQLNAVTMDVFSRLMMDRIIFLGVPIFDDAANIIQAQMLFLESVDPKKDIQIYINSPPMWPLSAPVWPPRWPRCFFAPEPRRNARRCRTRGS